MLWISGSYNDKNVLPSLIACSWEPATALPQCFSGPWLCSLCLHSKTQDERCSVGANLFLFLNWSKEQQKWWKLICHSKLWNTTGSLSKQVHAQSQSQQVEIYYEEIHYCVLSWLKIFRLLPSSFKRSSLSPQVKKLWIFYAISALSSKSRVS